MAKLIQASELENTKSISWKNGQYIRNNFIKSTVLLTRAEKIYGVRRVVALSRNKFMDYSVLLTPEQIHLS
jgi:hypothetical protein